MRCDFEIVTARNRADRFRLRSQMPLPSGPRASIASALACRRSDRGVAEQLLEQGALVGRVAASLHRDPYLRAQGDSIDLSAALLENAQPQDERRRRGVAVGRAIRLRRTPSRS